MAILEDRFANQDLSQTYNSTSESETSDLSDTEDELKQTKTTLTLSDGSDLISTTSDSEFDLDFNPDPKPWKNLNNYNNQYIVRIQSFKFISSSMLYEISYSNINIKCTLAIDELTEYNNTLY